MALTLKVLKVVFTGELAPHEIPGFRGAMARKVGWDQILFHNHLGEGLRYRYPLIQYKSFRRQPGIVCVGDGVDKVHHFFNQRDWSLQVSGRQLPMKIDRLDMQQVSLKVLDTPTDYRLHNWISLNQESYRPYQELSGIGEQVAFLERKLTGNILSFAKSLGWYIDQPIETTITRLGNTTASKVKGIPMLSFDIDFRSNVSLPYDIGLGKHVSLGFGVISPATRQESRLHRSTSTHTH